MYSQSTCGSQTLKDKHTGREYLWLGWRPGGYWMSSINAHLAECSKRLLNIQLVEQAAMTTL